MAPPLHVTLGDELINVTPLDVLTDPLIGDITGVKLIVSMFPGVRPGKVSCTPT